MLTERELTSPVPPYVPLSCTVVPFSCPQMASVPGIVSSSHVSMVFYRYFADAELVAVLFLSSLRSRHPTLTCTSGSEPSQDRKAQ